MSFTDDFRTNVEALPSILQRKYSLLRDLDKSLQDNQRQNEQRCEQEIEEMKRVIKSGNTPDTSLIRFSDEALEEQRHSVRIADEKVALSQQVYDLVDGHIQQLDQYLKKYDEDLRRENAAATTMPVSNSEKSCKRAESGRGRKKSRLAIAAAATDATEAATDATEAATSASNPTVTDIDVPIDPNEPTYCLCNQVSYGEMVACDNTNCKIEWFHFGCVGLKEQPKGKWYCSECSAHQKRKKGK